MVGTTGMDSDTIDVDIEFHEPCGLSGSGLTAAVACADGEFTRLRALTADTNLGEVDELLAGFECTAVVPGVCTIRVGPQDLPISGGANSANLVDEGGRERRARRAGTRWTPISARTLRGSGGSQNDKGAAGWRPPWAV